MTQLRHISFHSAGLRPGKTIPSLALLARVLFYWVQLETYVRIRITLGETFLFFWRTILTATRTVVLFLLFLLVKAG